MPDVQDISVDETPPKIGDNGGGPKPSPKLMLSDEHRRKLDSIVSKMVANKEKDEDIQAVVNDFKQKYAAPPVPSTPAPPEHEIAHTPLQDIRHVQEMANKPVATQTTTIDPMSGGSIISSNSEEEQQNKAYKAQYDKLATDLGAQWSIKPETVKQVLQDFPDEQDEEKLRKNAAIAIENPVRYSRLKNANDIRLRMAKDGPNGVHDANIFNYLQDAQNYQQLTEENIPYQQQLMRQHNLEGMMGQLEATQRPLINSIDPGLNQKYWESGDKELGLSLDEYAGLETERIFNPSKYQMDLGIIKHSRGIGEDGKANPLDMSTQPYTYQRGVENVKYNLAQTGRQNLTAYISEKRPEVDRQMNELVQGYKESMSFANQTEQQQLQQQFNNEPLVQQANDIENAAQQLQYSENEDNRLYPLNFNDQATRIVRDAMQGSGFQGSDIRHVANRIASGAFNTYKGTWDYIKNLAINIAGSDEQKALNNAKSSGEKSISDITGYYGAPSSGVEQPLNVPRETISAIQAIQNNSNLNADEKQQKSINYLKDNWDKLTVNPKAGQQNLTGKSLIYGAADMAGQIIGIASQSFLLGGVIGDASKLQKLTAAFMPMYMSTQDQLYQQAVKDGDPTPLLKSNIDAAIVSLASLINPDIKVVKAAAGVDSPIGKMIAGVSEDTWNKVLSTNKPILDQVTGSVKAAARQMGLAQLQYGLIAPTAQYVAHKSILNEDANLGDMIKDGIVQTSIQMAAPALLHGMWGGIKATQVNPMQKFSLVEVGLHPDQNIDLVESQIKSGQISEVQGHQIKMLIKHAGEFMLDPNLRMTDGTPMNEKQVADNLYNSIKKRALETSFKTAPEPLKPVIQEKIHEVNKEIADGFTSDADKQKAELNQLLHDNLDRIRDKTPTMEQPIKDAIAENRPEDVFKEIASQATETTKVEGKEVSSRPLAEEIFGKPLVEKAIELSKQSKTKNDELQNGQRQQANEGRQIAPENPSEGAATPVESAASSFLQSRHADTIHDEQGIVSGPNNKELSTKGKRDANDLAEDVKDKGVNTVVTSGLERSIETGKRVADKIGAKVESRPKLNTWDIKDFDGVTDEEFKKIQKWFAENPNEKVYNGPIEEYKGKEVGETINEYANRIIPEMTQLEKQYGPEMLLINHSNNMMLWDAYLKNGREWNDQARQDYLNAEKPEPATLINKTENNASSIRSDQGQGSPRGAVSQGSQNESGENLQQPSGQEAVNAAAEQQGGQQGTANTGPQQPPEGGSGTNGPQEPEQGVEKEQVISTKNKVANVIRSENGLPVVEIPKDRSEDESLNAWRDGTRTPQQIIDQLLSGKDIYDKSITPNDEPIMREYIRGLVNRGIELNKINESLNDKVKEGDENAIADQASIRQQLLNHYDEMARALDAERVGGNIWHKYGEERQMAVNEQGQVVNSINRIKAIYGDEMPQEIQTKLSDLQRRHDELVAKNSKIEYDLKKAQIENDLLKQAMAAKKTGQRQKKTDYDFAQERKDILADMKKALSKANKQLYSAVPLAPQLGAIAPHVLKLFKSFAEQGVSKLDDIVTNIHDFVKDSVEGISKENIIDILAGKHSDKATLPELQKTINDLRSQARLKSNISDLEKGITAVSKKKGEGIQEVEKLKKQLAEAKKKSIDKYANLSTEEIKKQADAIKKQIDNGDYFKMPTIKTKFENNLEWRKNEQAKADLKQELRNLEQKAYDSKKNMYMKGLDWVNRWGRRVIFFGANAVYTKLSSAAVIGAFAHRIPETLASKMNARLYPEIAKNAPIESNLNASTEATFYKEFLNLKKFAQNIWSQAKTGETPLSKELGRHSSEKHIPIVDLFAADAHAMIKDPVKRATFEAAVKAHLKFFADNSIDGTHPLMLESARQAAYKAAEYEIFQNSAKNASGIKKFFNELEKSGIVNANMPDEWSKVKGNAQYTASALYHFFVPINTVPLNILKRVGLGLRAPVQMIEAMSKNKAIRDGILNMSQEESDLLMRQLKKGQIGLAYWTLGFVLGGATFGGLYSRYYPDKDRKDTPKINEMNFGGVDVPKNVQHNTQFQSAQMGATWSTVYNHFIDDNGSSQIEALAKASAATAGAATESIPTLKAAASMYEATQTPYGGGKWVKDLKNRVGIGKATTLLKLMGYDTDENNGGTTGAGGAGDGRRPSDKW